MKQLEFERAVSSVLTHSNKESTLANSNRQCRKVREINNSNTSATEGTYRIELVGEEVGVGLLLRRAIEKEAKGWVLQTCAKADLVLRSVSPPCEPHVVVLNLEQIPTGNVGHIRKLKWSIPHARIIVLAREPEPCDVLACVLAGACGHLLKPISSSDLLSSIVKALEGRLAFCATSEKLLLEALHLIGQRNIRAQLTSREEQVLTGVFRAQQDKEIAKALGIGPGTVRVHLANIFKKLAVHNRDEAVAKFLGLGAS